MDESSTIKNKPQILKRLGVVEKNPKKFLSYNPCSFGNPATILLGS